LILLIYSFVTYRLRLFRDRDTGGRIPLMLGGLCVLAATVWRVVAMNPDYGDWFIPGAYPAIDLGQYLLVVLGILLSVIGIALYADSWQTRRDEIRLHESRLSILEDLQHHARRPYQLLELLNIALKDVLDRFPSVAGAVFLVNRNKRQFVLASASGLSREETAHLEYYPLEQNVIAQALELGDPMLTSRFQFYDRRGGTVTSRFSSCLILPLESGMEKIGGMILLSEERQYFDRSDIKSLIPIAQWLAEKIRSARFARELAQVKATVEKQTATQSELIARYSSVLRAMDLPDAPGAFCAGLVGLVGCESAHLYGLRQGELTFLGNSRPLVDYSEGYKTALVDALGRTRPLIINQEAEVDGGRHVVTQSSLVLPLGGDGNQGALLLRSEQGAFTVSDTDLKVLDTYASLARMILHHDSRHRLDTSRKRGFDTILQLLSAEDRPDVFSDDPGFFVRHLQRILPDDAYGFTLASGVGEVLSLVDPGSAGERLSGTSLEVFRGEGSIGKAAVSGQAEVVFGRSQLQRSLETYEPHNRDAMMRMFGEDGMPSFMACYPLQELSGVVGVTVVVIPGMVDRERSEWERLLILAAGLYSLRLTIDRLEQERRDETGLDGVTPERHHINRLNNHFSAIIGTAELASRDDTLSVDVRRRFARILEESERAVELIHLPPVADDSQSEVSVTVDSRAGNISKAVRRVLEHSHVSGDLYMVGGRAREIRLDLDKLATIEFSSEKIADLFEVVLDRFGATADDDDVITVSVYVTDDYVYLDLSRHRRNFPPVERVAGFGAYDHVDRAVKARPTDVYLYSLADTTSFYAVDQSAPSPAYLSFKFPIKGLPDTPSAKPAKEPVNILAVDDQQVILDLISAMGQSLGYRVATARSGEDGLRLAREQRFDLVMTDLAMPGMSGLELARRIREIVIGVPVVLVTGWEATLDKGGLASAGITDVLYKPFRIEQLTDLVQTLVRR
ncbi:MAG: response regulator, partial [candidate division Zixibacteria bacterium]|nr:response regulator [candidate division Zixibacteria bacterium]